MCSSRICLDINTVKVWITRLLPPPSQCYAMLYLSLILTSLLLKLMLIRSDCVAICATDQYAFLINEAWIRTEGLLMYLLTKACSRLTHT